MFFLNLMTLGKDIGTYFALILTNTVDENMLSIPDDIEQFLGEFKKILGEQSLKESFWIIDDKNLQEIGVTYLSLTTVFAMNNIKNTLGRFGADNQYHHEHLTPIAPTAAELKEKQKAKRKAQKQARKIIGENNMQRVINEDWLTKMTRAFQFCVTKIKKPYPTFYIATAKTLERAMKATIQQTAVQELALNEEGATHYLHGPLGDAIVIYMDNIPMIPKEVLSISLAHSIWYNLGRFFTINAEPKAWYYKYNGDSRLSGDAMHRGYHLLGEFVAEAMSNGVHDIYIQGRPDINDIARKAIADTAFDFLKEGVSNILVNENQLGAYFATAMTNPYASKNEDSIGKMPKKIRPHLNQIKKLLDEQLQKRHFWKITATTLREVGTEVIGMERIIMDKHGPIIRLMRGKHE